ncbi:MAG: hypothetical protein A2Y77_16790 [Planctomycetes bacterium RBG_13_62_9]|nr:MAG: hypothetical protein A2Y77_16790 [Planctomycetes bacterium RBG_13_62_9]
MNPTRIIVLANSLKHTDSCLAGLDISTGKWVRPVTNLNDGRVRKSDMKIGSHSPQLLDILDIPLDVTGPDFGFESENRTILPGQWYLRGRADVNDALKYAKRPRCILHNDWKYVTIEEMKGKAFEDRTTLELIHVNDFTIRDVESPSPEKRSWKGLVLSGGRVLQLPITDPVFCERLRTGHKPSESCLLTVSLSMPHKPPDWEADEPPAYWKLIAGIIGL